MSEKNNLPVTAEQIYSKVLEYNENKKFKRQIKINETACLNEAFSLIKEQLKRKGVKARGKKISISKITYDTVPDLNKIIGIVILWQEPECEHLINIFEEAKGRVIILPMKKIKD